METTTIVVTDPEMLKALAAATGAVQFRDAAGHLVGEMLMKRYGVPPPGIKRPFTEEELDRIQALPRTSDGGSLADFWKKIDEGRA